jgi:hypothetical protein
MECYYCGLLSEVFNKIPVIVIARSKEMGIHLNLAGLFLYVFITQVQIYYISTLLQPKCGVEYNDHVPK